MAWQIVAILLIVVGSISWFVRDERAERARALDLAARYYATAPRYRHRSPETAREMPPMPRVGRLSPAQRAYFVARWGIVRRGE